MNSSRSSDGLSLDPASGRKSIGNNSSSVDASGKPHGPRLGLLSKSKNVSTTNSSSLEIEDISDSDREDNDGPENLSNPKELHEPETDMATGSSQEEEEELQCVDLEPVAKKSKKRALFSQKPKQASILSVELSTFSTSKGMKKARQVYLSDPVPSTSKTKVESPFKIPTVKSTKLPEKLNKDKELECESCEARFTRRDHLNRHISSVHEGKKPYECDKCDRKFSQLGDMKKHISVVHEGIKPFTCEICGSGFPIKSVMKAHKESVHEGKRTCHCDLCGKNFASKQRLKSHVEAVHEGNKPIVNRMECTFCNKSFASKQRLKTHVDSIHEGKKNTVEKVQCEFCEKNFSSKQRLNGHISIVHESAKSKEKKKKRIKNAAKVAEKI